jgi:predicted cobalt transporter CbtA
MNASTLCFRAAMLLLLCGMIWGLQMAISGDHSAFPAHAHLNLLGFVSLFLFGIFYRLNPAVDANRLAIPQVWIWIASTIVTAIGVGLVHTGHAAGDPIAAIGTLVVFADAVLFTWLVFQAQPSADTSRASARMS